MKKILVQMAVTIAVEAVVSEFSMCNCETFFMLLCTQKISVKYYYYTYIPILKNIGNINFRFTMSK